MIDRLPDKAACFCLNKILERREFENIWKL